MPRPLALVPALLAFATVLPLRDSAAATAAPPSYALRRGGSSMDMSRNRPASASC
ncbi:MAG: hypothetical protein U0168_26970 [Nannocystaceae bacterium]